MKIFILFAIIFAASCKEKFDPGIRPEQTNFLVVEGFINVQGSTDIRLSRSAQLHDTAASQTEQGAVISIMGEDNSAIPLSEDTGGHYQSDSVSLNKNQKYRLFIKTAAGKDYLSDYVAVKQTPPIDSVSWRQENNGVNIYVNSHDKADNGRYYKWSFEETWEIHSRWFVLPGWVNGNVSATTQSERDKMFYCWRSPNSSDILLGSTAGLSNNIISMIPVVNILPDDERLSNRYSVLVKQIALDRQAYEFYQVMKKNTETTGTFFAPLPSDLPTNIHCVSNAAEKVIGFMCASTEEKKRIFISNEEVAGWNYQSGCESVLIYATPEGESSFFNNNYIPYNNKYGPAGFEGYYSSLQSCMDCRTRGSNVKPLFW